MSKKYNNTYVKSIDIEPKSDNQYDYMRAICENQVVFCTGPAGTGKTYIAIAMSLEKLLSQNIQRVIITRPIIETSASKRHGIGYLPGDLEDKISPYMRPAYDELEKMLSHQQRLEYLNNARNKRNEGFEIELAPLEYMRGRNFHNAYCVLDEAQNAEADQILMFLTRMGKTSKCIVVGDESQSDLTSGGLRFAIDACDGIDSVAHIRLTKDDIVRSGLVGEIITGFERHREYVRNRSDI